MLQNYVFSIIRTGVPGAVGWLIAWLTARGIDVPAESREWAVSGLTFAFMLAYYVIVRFLEARWPKLGVLLGVPARPKYPAVGGAQPPAVGPARDPQAGFADVILIGIVVLCLLAVFGGIFVGKLLFWLLVIAALLFLFGVLTDRR